MSKCKASEIPRNEVYARGIRHMAQGSREQKFFRYPAPSALRPAPHSYAAVTRDEGNAADERFRTASIAMFNGSPYTPDLHKK